MEPLISIIVPVYKAEPYLERCVSSLVEQTYRNLEIILVDDGSPDRCPELCDQWKNRDSRIRVLHQSNGGISAARNAGMKIATGDYILFEDSDDWLERNTVELLYQVGIEQDADIVQAKGIAHSEGEETFRMGKKGEVLVFSTYDALCKMLQYVEPFRIVAFGKLFRRSVLDGISFPEGRIHEDDYTIPDIIWKANKYVILNEPLYYYRLSPNSVMRSAFSEKRLDALYALEHRMAWCKENHLPELYLLSQKRYIRKLYELALQVKESTLPNRADILRQLKQKMAGCRKTALQNPKLLPVFLKKSLQMKLL